MRNVSLAIPDDVYFEISSLPNKETTLNAKLQLIFAIGMFVSHEVSLSKAAQLAGLNLVDFMETLKIRGIPSVIYTEGMYLEDMDSISKPTRNLIDEACGMLKSDGHAVDRFMASKRIEKELEYGN